MKPSKKLISLLSSLAIACSISYAHAGLIGTGSAVSHVDAAKATVTKLAGNLYSISMPKRTSGQWMGVRSIKGKDKIKVGNLTAKQLSVGWKRLLYTSSPVRGTLTWKECCDKREFAPIHVVGKPKRASTGVIFNVTSSKILPSTLELMSLHLAHASNDQVNQSITKRSEFAQKSDTITTFPSTQTENIVDDLWISSYNANASSLEMRIYNSSNNNTCWSYSWNDVPQNNIGDNSYSVGSNTCDDISYSNYANGSNPYGAMLETTNTPIIYDSFNLNITPSGEASYHYSYTFEGWNDGGP